MNERQAGELLDAIELSHGPGAAEVRRLANGDCAVVMKDGFFCWSFADYQT